MNNTFIFLRHGKTKVDKDAPISKWVLSDVGESQALKVAENEEFKNVDIIITSAEEKAFRTGKPLADFLNKKILQFEELSEMNRDEGGFMDADKYEETAQEALSNLDVSVSKWEAAGKALERFSKKIEEIDRQYEGKKILIIGHGYTINMYFAKLLGESKRVYERLGTNDFCDWGIAKDGKVLKDLGPDLGRVSEKLV